MATAFKGPPCQHTLEYLKFILDIRNIMTKNHAELKKKIENNPPMKEVPWRDLEGSKGQLWN